MTSTDKALVLCFVIVGLTISTMVAGCVVDSKNHKQFVENMATQGYEEVVESLPGQDSTYRSWKKTSKGTYSEHP